MKKGHVGASIKKFWAVRECR